MHKDTRHIFIINKHKYNMRHIFVIIAAKKIRTYLKIHGINNFHQQIKKIKQVEIEK
jgi:hypothetical protein